MSLETIQLSYSSILVAFFRKKKKKGMSHHEICTTEHIKQKDVSHREFQKYVSTEFWSRTYKSTGIDECAGVPGNYSISKLKLRRNLTSAQAKNGFSSSLDSSLESKRKIL